MVIEFTAGIYDKDSTKMYWEIINNDILPSLKEKCLSKKTRYTMYKNNRRYNSKLKGYRPLQLSCILQESATQPVSILIQTNALFFNNFLISVHEIGFA